MASECADDEKHRSLIEQYQSYIRQLLVPSHVLPSLSTIIKLGDINELKKIERKSREKAVDKLLGLLMNSNQPGWFKAFLQALELTGFEMLAGALEGKREIRNTGVFKELVGIFYVRLCDVNPKDICPFLIELDTISNEDYRDIELELRQGDRRDGMNLLLLRLPIRKNNWFADLIRALKKTGDRTYINLAEEMEPVISKACDLGDDYNVMRATQELNENVLIDPAAVLSLNSFYDVLPRASTETCSWDRVSEAPMEYEEFLTTDRPLEAGFLEATPVERADREEMPLNLAQNVTQPSTIQSKCTGTSWPFNYSSSPRLDHEVTTSNRLNEEDKCLLPVPEDGYRQRVEILNNLSTTYDKKYVSKKNPIWNIFPGCNAESAANLGTKVECQEGELDYQRQLVKSALTRGNVIIAVPKDSSKMTVALHIIQEHLDLSQGGKVIFLVPTPEQARTYASYQKAFKTHSFIVKADQLEASLSHDIIFTTPHVLLKAKLGSFRVFTLMVFDECQLAVDDHPYTQVMMEYLTEKLAEDGNQPPQIVGITTPLCIGKARSVQKAASRILSLCAILDATGGVITVEKQKDELNKPNEEKIQTPTRKDDPYNNLVICIMDKIESYMKQYAEEQNLQELITLLDRSATRGSDEYKEWISRVHKEAATIKLQDIRRPIYACQAHLKIYNISLVINEYCRTADALDYIQNAFSEIRETENGNTERRLNQLFRLLQDELKSISMDLNCDSPRLKKIAEQILAKYKQNQDLRAIVFCETEQLTTYLQKWIEKSQHLNVLKASCLPGTNVSRQRGGSTRFERQDALSFFKNGKYNVLIAPSTAKTWLDTNSCHLVVIYESLEKEIIIVRAEGHCNRDPTQSDAENKVREDIMNEAIQRVRTMPPDVFQDKIRALEREAKRIQSTTDREKSRKTARPVENEWYPA